MVSKALSMGCILSNIITMIAGFILLIGGILITQSTTFLHSIWTEIYGLAIYSIVISVSVIIIGLCLIYVVQRKFPALTTFFSVLMIIFASAAAISIIILLSGRASVYSASSRKLDMLINNYSRVNPFNGSNIFIDGIQQKYKCCGILEPKDWILKYTDNSSVPDSCCKHETTDCGKNSLFDKDRIFSNGCLESIGDATGEKYVILIGMTVPVLILALLSAILGLFFQRNVEQEYQAM